jgi:hypothetical protein
VFGEDIDAVAFAAHNKAQLREIEAGRTRPLQSNFNE